MFLLLYLKQVCGSTRNKCVALPPLATSVELSLGTLGICATVSMPKVCIGSSNLSIQGANAKVKLQRRNLVGFTECSTRGYNVVNIHMIHKDPVTYSKGIMSMSACESLVLRFVDVHNIPVHEPHENQKARHRVAIPTPANEASATFEIPANCQRERNA